MSSKRSASMDEILVANFMLFDDVVREDAYDLWIGDEAWELDHFLHENPRAEDRAVRLPHRLRRLAAGGRADEACLTADHNAENIGHVEGCRAAGRGRLRRRARGLVPDSFGPGLPTIRDWVPHHFDFSGYVSRSTRPTTPTASG